MTIGATPLNHGALAVAGADYVAGGVLRFAQDASGSMPALMLNFVQIAADQVPISGAQMAFAQTVASRRNFTGNLAAFAQHVISIERKSGAVMRFAQSAEMRLGGTMVRLGQVVLDARSAYPYAPRSHADGVGYQVRVMIGGQEVDPCRLFRTMSVTYREDESAQASLQLLEPRGVVDLYEFYNRRMQVFVQTEAGPLVCIYTGVIDVPQIDLQKRQMTLSASNNRADLINAMSADAVGRIGWWTESVFGARKDYKTQAEELADRMTTIPASLNFDAGGQAWLAEWRPKQTPDKVIGDCTVYARQTVLTMGSAGGMVNTVNIKLSNRFERLLHRQIEFSYQYETGNPGQLPCWIAWEGPPPKYDDVWSAATGAGWGVGYFRTTGTPKSGYYDCGGVPAYFKAKAYSYDYEPSGNTDAAGNQIMNVLQTGEDGETSDLYCMDASWRANKRWRQSVDERYVMVVSNAASVRLHGKKEETLAYTVAHDADKNMIAKNWESNKSFAAPYGYLAANGDYVTNVDDVIGGEYARAWQCAYNIAYSKILQTHRNNTLSLQCRFMPDIDLRYTAKIDLRQFAGLVKVREYTHTVDFVNKRAGTEVVGAFFKNPLAKNEDSITLLGKPPARPVLPVHGYQRQYVLQNYIVPHGAKIIETDDADNGAGLGESLATSTAERFLLYNCRGFVRKETGYTYYKHKIKRAYAFRVVTPDIESGSRDTLEQDAGTTAVPVNVFDTPVEVRI